MEALDIYKRFYDTATEYKPFFDLLNARARIAALEEMNRDMLSELIEFCKGNCDTCRMKSCHETCGLKQAKELIERATGHKIKEVLV